MIKHLQKKFVTTAMTAITALIILLLGAINVTNMIIVQNDISRRLRIISDNELTPFTPPEMSSPNQPYPDRIHPRDDHDLLSSSPFFTVLLNSSNEIVNIDTSRIPSLDESTAEAILRQALENNDSTGKINKFRYSIFPSKDGFHISAVFLDTTDEIYSYIRILLLSAGIGAICWLLMLLFVILLSKKAIRPIAENIEKQKQFVTNAGHEIKTPLAIIQSNADAMELYMGENKWTKNIKCQTARLNGLMQNLLLLARSDELRTENNALPFSLSSVLNESATSFSVPMSLRKLTLQADIQPDITLTADKEQITQLIYIFLDNVCKYAKENSTVSLSLRSDGKHTLLQIKNECNELPNVPPNRLFDRFYRANAARTQASGGYGIGLSVAEAIVKANKGDISAAYEEPDLIQFTVIF